MKSRLHRHGNLSVILWSIAVLLFALFLCVVPLFDILGFEFAAATGVLFFLVQGSLATGRVGDLRRRIAASAPREHGAAPRGSGVSASFSLFFSGLPALLLHCTISLAVILLNMARVPNCDPVEGLLFFVLIPVVSGLLGNALGLVAGLAAGSRSRAHLILLLFVLASAMHSLYYLFFHPGTFTTSAIIGLFPGPVYEEALSITLPLLLARIMTLTGTAAVLLLSAATFDPERRRPALSPREWNSPRRQCFGLFLAALVLLGSGYGYRGDLGIATSRRFLHSKLDGLLKTEHFDIRYERNSPVAEDLALIAADHEFRFNQITSCLDVDFGKRITSYIYSSPGQKKRLIGAGGTMIGDPMNLEMHLNYGRFPIPVLKHELTHVISSAFGLPIVGVGRNVGLMEGVAEAVEWDGGDLTLHQRCRVMAQLSLLPDVRRLMSGFNLWAESAATSYPACGSFVRFLMVRYGARRLKEVYSSGKFGDVYGKNIDMLVREWEGFIAVIDLPDMDFAAEEYRLRRPSILHRVCARKIASILEEGDACLDRRRFAAAASLYRDAYRLNTGDPRALWRLARAQYGGNDLESAEESALLLELHSNSIPLHGISARKYAESTLHCVAPETASVSLSWFTAPTGLQSELLGLRFSDLLLGFELVDAGSDRTLRSPHACVDHAGE